MDIFIVKPHSTIDLITNSSSEIFILNKYKSLEFIKEILQDMLNSENELNKKLDYDTENLKEFSDVFREPIILDTWKKINEFVTAYYVYIDPTTENYSISLKYDDNYYKNIKKFINKNKIRLMKEYMNVLIIESASDNAISSQIMKNIEYKLNASRYQIG